jgi:VanZ family protein
LPSIEESAQTSGRVLEILNNVLSFFGLPLLKSDFLIRKAAHFIEFFVLGASLFGYTLFNRVPDKNTVIRCAFLSCIIAMTDETIQHFTDRGSMLLDVWLDFIAALIAISLFYLIYQVKFNKKH